MPPQLIGYARVSTDDQSLNAQQDELRAAGCSQVFTDKASGVDTARPQLLAAIAALKPGSVLVVVRLDRLARSLQHLLSTIERIKRAGADFRSLRDPVDTSSPQGLFSLQILGAVAELERALIRERTKAGLRAAAARGRKGGNPRIKAKDPAALAALAEGNRRRHLERVIASAETWLPHVRTLRPRLSWQAIARRVGPGWSGARLRHAVASLAASPHRALLGDEAARRAILGRADRPPPPRELYEFIQGVLHHDPEISLEELAVALRSAGKRSPRGGTTWNRSSVRHLKQQMAKRNLLPTVEA